MRFVSIKQNLQNKVKSLFINPTTNLFYLKRLKSNISFQNVFNLQYRFQTQGFNLSFFSQKFRAKVDPKNWPIGKDDPDPIIPNDDEPNTESKTEPKTESKTSETPKTEQIESHVVEPTLNPNVPEFVPYFVAKTETVSEVSTKKDSSSAKTKTETENDEAGTDGDTEEDDEEEEKIGKKKSVEVRAADWVEVSFIFVFLN